MKVTFESEDTKEINRLAKSLDMALALWKITTVNNLNHKSINEILEKYKINLIELIE
jgi:hypothetical protein